MRSDLHREEAALAGRSADVSMGATGECVRKFAGAAVRYRDGPSHTMRGRQRKR